MEKTLSLKIQSRIEELQGGEEYQNKLAQRLKETLDQVNNLSPNLKADQNPDLDTHNIPQEDRKAVNSIGRTVRATIEELNEKFLAQFEEFQRDEQVYGLNHRATQTKWKNRFYKLGEKEVPEAMTDITDAIRNNKRGRSDEAKEYLDILDQEVRAFFKNVNTAFKEFGDYIPEYAKSIKEFKETNDSLFEMLQKGGYLALAQQIGMQSIGIAKNFEQMEARDRTSFNLSSPQGMYNEAEQAELYRKTTTNSMVGGGIGSIIGGIAGGLLGGNPLFVAGGMSIGSSIGNEVAELFNIGEKADVEEHLKFINQSYAEIEKDYARIKAYKVPLQKLTARFGDDITKNEGLGYTPEQELQFKEQFASSLRKYDQDLYRDQLTFSRATGLNFGDIAQSNDLTRFTGEEFDLKKLSQIKSFTDTIYGEDNKDLKRIVEVLASIKDISLKQLDRAVNADSRDAERFLSIPQNLFGVDNPYGKLGELGGKTIQLLEGLMQPTGTAHEALLFQALGKNGIRDFNERMKGGIYDGNNFRDILEYVEKESNGDEVAAYWKFNGMIPNAPKDWLTNWSKLVSDQSIDVNIGAGKKESVDMKGFLENFEKGINSGDSGEKVISDLLEKSKANITSYESVEEKLANVQLKLGEQWTSIINDSQLKMAEFADKWLSSGTAIEKVTEMINVSLELIEKRLNGFGVSTTNQSIENVKEEIIKKHTGIDRRKGETLNAYIDRSAEHIYVDEFSGDNPQGDYKSYLQEEFNKVDKRFERGKKNNSEASQSIEATNFDKGQGFRKRAQNTLKEELKSSDYSFKQISGYRTKAENDELKRQGKPASDTSLHLSGNAFDLQFYDKKEKKYITNEMITEDVEKNGSKKYGKLLKQLEKYAKDNNLFWGGKFKDKKLRNREWNHFSNNDWTKEQQDAALELIKDFESKIEVPKKTKDIEVKLDKADQKSTSQIDSKSENQKDDIEKLLLNLSKAVSVNKEQKPIEITIKFVDTPLAMMDSVQNAIVGIS